MAYNKIPTVFNELRQDPFLVGFDQFFDRLLSTGVGSTQAASYPPYNIVKVSDSEFRIELAVAGFTEDEIDVTVQDDKLTVESRKDHSVDGGGEVLLHQGIAERNFKRVWTLSPTIAVDSAKFVNGLLTINLKNETPEKEKPRKIPFS
jgi:molecular chaperone IbpA